MERSLCSNPAPLRPKLPTSKALQPPHSQCRPLRRRQFSLSTSPLQRTQLRLLRSLRAALNAPRPTPSLRPLAAFTSAGTQAQSPPFYSRRPPLLLHHCQNPGPLYRRIQHYMILAVPTHTGCKERTAPEHGLTSVPPYIRTHKMLSLLPAPTASFQDWWSYERIYMEFRRGNFKFQNFGSAHVLCNSQPILSGLHCRPWTCTTQHALPSPPSLFSHLPQLPLC
jgi:hypothetical protein